MAGVQGPKVTRLAAAVAPSLNRLAKRMRGFCFMLSSPIGWAGHGEPLARSLWDKHEIAAEWLIEKSAGARPGRWAEEAATGSMLVSSRKLSSFRSDERATEPRAARSLELVPPG